MIVVLRGRFLYDDRTGRAVVSPAQSLFLREGDTYGIRHLDEDGDVCLALQGDLCDALVAQGKRARPLPEASYLRLRKLAAELSRGVPRSRLAVEDALCSALAPHEPPTGPLRPREREAAEAIAYGIERGFEVNLPLGQLAAQAGLTVFHACRVFKRATGCTIHGYQQEIRLRHALACLLETRRPIADIALELGFANQGHLTNRFRRRFRTTPARVRRDGAVPSSSPAA